MTDYTSVLAHLGKTALLESLTDKTLISYLWIDPPTVADHAKKVSHAFLLKETGELVAYSEHSTEVPHWSQGYVSKKDVGYIFSISEIQDAVFLAIEKLLASKEYTIGLLCWLWCR